MSLIKLTSVGPHSSYNDLITFLKGKDWLLLPPQNYPLLKLAAGSATIIVTAKQFFDQEYVEVPDGLSFVSATVDTNISSFFGFRTTSSPQSTGYPTTGISMNWTTTGFTEESYQIFTEGFDTKVEINFVSSYGGVIALTSDAITDSTKLYKGVIPYTNNDNPNNTPFLTHLTHDGIKKSVKAWQEKPSNFVLFRKQTKTYSVPGFVPDKTKISANTLGFSYGLNNIIQGAGGSGYNFSRKLVFWDGVDPVITVDPSIFGKVVLGEGIKVPDQDLGSFEMPFIYTEGSDTLIINSSIVESEDDLEFSENISVSFLPSGDISIEVQKDPDTNVFEDGFIRIKKNTPVGGEDEEWQLMIIALKAKGEKNG